MPKEYRINIRPLMDDRRQQELAAFITQVKVVFKDNKEKYSEFVQSHEGLQGSQNWNIKI
jgi:hypothetical protein